MQTKGIFPGLLGILAAMTFEGKNISATKAEFSGSASWLSILGAAFFWVWMDRAMFGDSLFLGAPFDWLPFTFSVSLLASVATLLVLTWHAPAFTKRSVFSRPWAVVFGVTGALASGAIALAAPLNLPPLLYGGAVLLGIAMFSMNIGWGVVFVAQGTYKAFLNVAGAWAGGLIINGLVQLLVPEAQEIATILLPLISMGLYVLNASLQAKGLYAIAHKASEPDAAVPGLPRSILWAAVASLVFCLAFGFMYGTIIFPATHEAAAGVFDALGTRGLTALLFLLVGITPLRKYFLGLVTAFLLLMTLGVVLVSIQLMTGEAQALACMIISLSYAAFDIAIWMLIAAACTGSTSQNARIVACVMAAQQGGILGGQLCALFLQTAGFELDTMVLMAPLYLFLLASIALIKLCFDAWNSGALSFALESGKTRRTTEEQNALDAALRAFANRYDLTSREVEVLRFIREGRSVPYIAQALVVSENTVKTHLRHVYTKCDVHNRQALLDLMNA